MSLPAVGASKPSFWDVARHATEQYDKNQKSLESSCEKVFAQKAHWEKMDRGLTEKARVTGEPAFLSPDQYEREAAVYSSLEKSNKLAMEILETLGRAISVCTRPPISEDDYETLRGLDRDIEELRGDEKALKDKLMDLRNKHIEINLICDQFKERLPKAEAALNVLFYRQEGKSSRVMEALGNGAAAVGNAAAAVGSALVGAIWRSSETAAQPASAAPDQSQQQPTREEDAPQPGASPAPASQALPSGGPAAAASARDQSTFAHVLGQGGAGKGQRKPPAPPRQGQGGGGTAALLGSKLE